MPFFNFPRGRNKLTVEQATDVILHCTKPSQDADFAEKYDVSERWIERIRKKEVWYWLWQKLETGWRP